MPLIRTLCTLKHNIRPLSVFVPSLTPAKPGTVWPSDIIRQFERTRSDSSEENFHDSYNKLLNTLFPPTDSNFTVTFNFTHEFCALDVTDFLLTFRVLYKDRPVLACGFKSKRDMSYSSMRRAVDVCMREDIADMAEKSPLSVLHAVSAMGTRLRFYRVPKDGPLPPLPINPRPGFETDIAPKECWDCDILEEEGMRRFQAVVDEIKQGCASQDQNGTPWLQMDWPPLNFSWSIGPLLTSLWNLTDDLHSVDVPFDSNKRWEIYSRNPYFSRY